MLHRAIFGTFERFIGILIEHHAGQASRSGWRRCRRWSRRSSPTPTIMPTRSSATLQAAGLRVETDLRNEKINYKVREHSLAKVPLCWSSASARPRKARSPLRPLGADEHQEVMSRSTRSLARPRRRRPCRPTCGDAALAPQVAAKMRTLRRFVPFHSARKRLIRALPQQLQEKRLYVRPIRAARMAPPHQRPPLQRIHPVPKGARDR